MTTQAVQRLADASQSPIEVRAVTPMEILQRAIEKGTDIDQLTKLMDLQERWERSEARKAFVAALSAFKADPPTIVKNKHVSFGGGKAAYDHATLDQVCEIIGKALSEHGLSHTWKMKQADNAMVTVTCVVTHKLGHSEETALSAMPDNSGSKNVIQAVGSTVTYLQRYTLLAATGLATTDQDDDGDKGGKGELIDANQKDQLIALIRETETDTAKFCKYLGVESVDDIPAGRFNDALQALMRKRGK